MQNVGYLLTFFYVVEQKVELVLTTDFVSKILFKRGNRKYKNIYDSSLQHSMFHVCQLLRAISVSLAAKC